MSTWPGEWPVGDRDGDVALESGSFFPELEKGLGTCCLVLVSPD